MFGSLKSRGQNFTVAEANALLRMMTTPVIGVPQIMEPGQTGIREEQLPRLKSYKGKNVSGDVIAPWSIVCLSIITVGNIEKSADVLIGVDLPTSVNPVEIIRCAMFTNEGYEIPVDTWGSFKPVTLFEPTIVRTVATPHTPEQGDICGVDGATGFATKRRGGLLCVRDGIKLFVDEVEKDCIAVIPAMPGWWSWGITAENDGDTESGMRKVNLRYISSGVLTSTGKSVSARCPPLGASLPPINLTVIVSVDPASGEFHITNVVGCLVV